INFGNVYYGLASRVRDLTVESVKTKTSVAMSRPMAYHAEVQHGVAEMVMELEAIGPHLDTVARDWSEGVPHPDMPIKIVAAKHHAVEGAFRIVDRALDLSGGFGMFKKSELERLFRDCRAGRFHPARAAAALPIGSTRPTVRSCSSRPRRIASPGPARPYGFGAIRPGTCRSPN